MMFPIHKFHFQHPYQCAIPLSQGQIVCLYFACGFRLKSSVNRTGHRVTKTERKVSNNAMRAVKFTDTNKQHLDTRAETLRVQT